MRVIQHHADYFEYEPIEKEISIAENAEKKKVKFDDLAVLFVSIEKDDNEKIIKSAIKEIKSSLDNLKVNKVLIHPYAHLSSNLAKPSDALDLLKKMEIFMKEIGIETYRSPFGWNKQFSIKIKAHPMAEQFKVFSSDSVREDDGEVSQALKQEEKVISEWFILKPDGSLVDAKKFDFKKHKNLEKFFNYEYAKVRAVSEVPAHVKLMKALQLVDYEPGSDPGNFRFLPKGRLMKSLLEMWVTQKIINYGGMEVETPIMYDYDHPALKSYLNRFPARQYTVESAKKKFFLRFSACFGQFLTAAASQISYKDLPMKIYELTRYSFRLEKAGELVGLRRLRAFTMPDMHTLCKDLEQAKKEYTNQYKLSIEALNDLGLSVDDFEVAIRFTKDFWKENKNFVINLVELVNKPVLIEMWNFRYAYFDPKFEFNFVDSMDKASALSTVQIDHENGERFNMKYTDEDGKSKYPLVLHCSPSGSLERVFYAILEKAYLESKKGNNPELPVWLSPIQVRLCPINSDFIGYCEEIAKELELNNIRVDIDDRVESIDKKIRNSEMEWIPFILVIGKREKESKEFNVRIRKEKSKETKMKMDDLVKLIKNEMKDKPLKSLSLPKKLSQRPIFI
ncbi:MAG: threonine--tRNA ligase [Candidatus Aenigmarchaeota archaeon]|nr:threonine--tRNA ligase [Candidatus Aenigmarchaeota archaeon]